MTLKEKIKQEKLYMDVAYRFWSVELCIRDIQSKIIECVRRGKDKCVFVILKSNPNDNEKEFIFRYLSLEGMNPYIMDDEHLDKRCVDVVIAVDL
jgi:hypothetical protein